MATYYIGSDRPQRVTSVLTMLGDIQTITLDFGVWADDTSAVTSVTWTTESGQAAISSASVTSSVATATLTTSTAGRSMVKAVATNGTQSIAVYIPVVCKDPQAVTAPDYDLVSA